MVVHFILGEDKYIKFLIYSTKNDEFTIENASYTLLKDGMVETNGICNIEGHYISVKLKPKEPSTLYALIIKYEIAGEIFKKRIDIEVENECSY